MRPPGARRVVTVGHIAFGTGSLVVIAGPCAVETPEQLELAAASVRASGAHMLRGGAHKPRTSPHSFQGLGEKGIELLVEAGRRHGMPVVAEVMDIAQLPSMVERVDLLQVGARNMQNFSLLKALGRQRRPVLLKRGLAATLEEWLLAAEYVTSGGNENVILCERGIRTFGQETRFTLDLGAVAWLRQRCELPIVVDPSHASGVRELVAPLTLAAAAAGADGVMIEVHPQPDAALCDGPQALTPLAFDALMKRLHPVAQALGRQLYAPALPDMPLPRLEAR